MFSILYVLAFLFLPVKTAWNRKSKVQCLQEEVEERSIFQKFPVEKVFSHLPEIVQVVLALALISGILYVIAKYYFRDLVQIVVNTTDSNKITKELLDPLQDGKEIEDKEDGSSSSNQLTLEGKYDSIADQSLSTSSFPDDEEENSHLSQQKITDVSGKTKTTFLVNGEIIQAGIENKRTKNSGALRRGNGVIVEENNLYPSNMPRSFLKKPTEANTSREAESSSKNRQKKEAFQSRLTSEQPKKDFPKYKPPTEQLKKDILPSRAPVTSTPRIYPKQLKTTGPPAQSKTFSEQSKKDTTSSKLTSKLPSKVSPKLMKKNELPSRFSATRNSEENSRKSSSSKLATEESSVSKNCNCEVNNALGNLEKEMKSLQTRATAAEKARQLAVRNANQMQKELTALRADMKAAEKEKGILLRSIEVLKKEKIEAVKRTTLQWKAKLENLRSKNSEGEISEKTDASRETRKGSSVLTNSRFHKNSPRREKQELTIEDVDNESGQPEQASSCIEHDEEDSVKGNSCTEDLTVPNFNETEFEEIPADKLENAEYPEINVIKDAGNEIFGDYDCQKKTKNETKISKNEVDAGNSNDQLGLENVDVEEIEKAEVKDEGYDAEPGLQSESIEEISNEGIFIKDETGGQEISSVHPDSSDIIFMRIFSAIDQQQMNAFLGESINRMDDNNHFQVSEEHGKDLAIEERHLPEEVTVLRLNDPLSSIEDRDIMETGNMCIQCNKEIDILCSKEEIPKNNDNDSFSNRVQSKNGNPSSLQNSPRINSAAKKSRNMNDKKMPNLARSKSWDNKSPRTKSYRAETRPLIEQNSTDVTSHVKHSLNKNIKPSSIKKQETLQPTRSSSTPRTERFTATKFPKSGNAAGNESRKEIEKQVSIKSHSFVSKKGDTAKTKKLASSGNIMQKGDRTGKNERTENRKPIDDRAVQSKASRKPITEIFHADDDLWVKYEEGDQSDLHHPTADVKSTDILKEKTEEKCALSEGNEIIKPLEINKLISEIAENMVGGITKLDEKSSAMSKESSHENISNQLEIERNAKGETRDEIQLAVKNCIKDLINFNSSIADDDKVVVEELLDKCFSGDALIQNIPSAEDISIDKMKILENFNRNINQELLPTLSMANDLFRQGNSQQSTLKQAENNSFNSTGPVIGAKQGSLTENINKYFVFNPPNWSEPDFHLMCGDQL